MQQGWVKISMKYRKIVSFCGHDTQIISNIELRGEIKYCFSNSIGKISNELASKMAKK